MDIGERRKYDLFTSSQRFHECTLISINRGFESRHIYGQIWNNIVSYHMKVVSRCQYHVQIQAYILGPLMPFKCT